MKRTIVPWIITACTLAVISAPADIVQAAEAKAKNQEVYKGTVTAVDPEAGAVTVDGFWMDHTFHLGEHRLVWLEDKPDAALSDLRPGHQVEVHYVTHDGVRVASQIVQHDLAWEGHLTDIDPQARTLKVRSGLRNRTFKVAEECRISTRDRRDVKLEDLQPGHKVRVEYVEAKGPDLAIEVQETSLTFTGNLQAIDADVGMIKASKLLDSRVFRLAEDCQIMLDGQLGELSHLRIGQSLTVSYEDVDGVLVANRIAPEMDSSSEKGEQLSQREDDHRK